MGIRRIIKEKEVDISVNGSDNGDGRTKYKNTFLEQLMTSYGKCEQEVKHLIGIAITHFNIMKQICYPLQHRN